MIIKILTLLVLAILSGCSAVTFDKGLNYEKISGYSFNYDKGTQGTSITNQQNGNRISIAFRRHYCGSYGLIGPLIFPIVPIWQKLDCKDVVIGIGDTENVYIIYHNQIYNPSKISKTGYYTFPLQTKSITDTAILVVEKKDGQKFEIPFRYQHTFSFDLWPGR
jgi:hypothetical protein